MRTFSEESPAWELEVGGSSGGSQGRQVLSADILSQDENWCETPPYPRPPLPHQVCSLSCLKLMLPPSLSPQTRRGGRIHPPTEGSQDLPFCCLVAALHNQAPSSPLRPPPPFPMLGPEEALTTGEGPESPVCQGAWSSS